MDSVIFGLILSSILGSVLGSTLGSILGPLFGSIFVPNPNLVEVELGFVNSGKLSQG